MKQYLILFVAAVGACTQQAKAPESSAAEERVLASATPGECVDDEGNVAQCEIDADCCQGFACAKDPDVGQLRRVCVFAEQQ